MGFARFLWRSCVARTYRPKWFVGNDHSRELFDRKYGQTTPELCGNELLRVLPFEFSQRIPNLKHSSPGRRNLE
jgi:hypothetical protein